MFEKYLTLLNKLFLGMNLSDYTSNILSETISLITLLTIAIIAYLIVNLIITKTIQAFIKKSKSKRDDIIIKNKVIKRLCLLIPAYLIRYYIIFAIPGLPVLSNIIVVLTKVYEIFIYSQVLDAIVTTLSDIYNTYEVSKNKPIKGFVQVIKTTIYIVCILLSRFISNFSKKIRFYNLF